MASATKPALNLSRLLRPIHQNRWVAISSDYTQVLDSATTLKELLRSTKTKDAVYHRVLPAGISFAP